jgi:hypothetical protein
MQDDMTISGSADLQRVHVGQDVILDSVRFTRPADFSGATVGGNLRLEGATFNGLNLTGIAVKGALILGVGRRGARWTGNGYLRLGNASVQSIQDREDAWPDRIDFTGFTYSRLGLLDPTLRIQYGGRVEVSAFDYPLLRDVRWYKDWLLKQDYYAPQPYLQLASVFREAGETKKADEILFTSKNRERDNSTGTKFVQLFLSHIFIGYGFRYHYAVFWVIGWTLLGAVAIKIGQRQKVVSPGLSAYRAIIYSFGSLIPVAGVKRRWFDDVETAGWLDAYFIIHQLAGFVLASFIVAGVAGITQGY